MRTRDLKPDFWTDERIVSVSDGAKLLFQGLWALADREGRLEDKPVTIGFKVRPWDPSRAPELLVELADAGLIIRYAVDGVRCIGIPGFPVHQRVHPKEMVSKLPDWKGLELSREKVNPSPASPGKIENSVSQSGPSGPSIASGPAGPAGPSVTYATAPSSPSTAKEPPLPKAPVDRFASGEAFWAHVQHQRRELGFVTEKPPKNNLSHWWSEVLMELNGDPLPLDDALRRFGANKHWATSTPPWPFDAFIKNWRDYVRRKPRAA